MAVFSPFKRLAMPSSPIYLSGTKFGLNASLLIPSPLAAILNLVATALLPHELFYPAD